MLTVLAILAVAGLICTILAGMGKCPLWVAVLLLAIVVVILVIPASGVGVVVR